MNFIWNAILPHTYVLFWLLHREHWTFVTITRAWHYSAQLCNIDTVGFFFSICVKYHWNPNGLLTHRVFTESLFNRGVKQRCTTYDSWHFHAAHQLIWVMTNKHSNCFAGQFQLSAKIICRSVWTMHPFWEKKQNKNEIYISHCNKFNWTKRIGLNGLF